METKKDATTRFDFINEDKRIIDQKLRKHKISQTEYQKILKNTEDDKETADELVVFNEPTFEPDPTS